MSWNPDRNYRANVKTGMWIPIVATIASVDYPVYAGFGGVDKLFAEGNSQHTDYELEFRTNDLPSLKVGDTVTINGDTYTVKTMPAYSDESEYFSECNLQRTTRSYPKRAIQFPGEGTILPPPPAPGPAPSGDGNHVAPYAFAFGDATPALLLTVPVGRAVIGIVVDIDIAFNGVGAQIEIGQLALPFSDFYVNRIDVDPATVAQYEIAQDPSVAAGQPMYLRIVPGAGATQGAGQISFFLSPA